VKNLNDASASIGKVVDANNKVSVEMEKSVKEISETYISAANNLKNSSDKASTGINQLVTEFTSTYKATVDAMKATSEKASKEIEQTAGNFTTQLKSSVEELKNSYKEMSTSLTSGFKSLDKNSGKYVENIEKINKNLAALNAAYEMQLQGAGKAEEMVNTYSKGVAEVGKLLQKSVEETKKFNDNTKEINENIQSLNKVYGNMLGALNVKK
jgi:methyl-accepting chemotaxis protein